MNEFEWLKQTRALGQPVPPKRDLWSGIAARIETMPRSNTPRSSRLLPWAMAASLAVVSLLAGTVVWQQSPASSAQSMARTTPWITDNPQLQGAAIELNIARLQLARAIDKSPRSAYLRRMLKHTNQQVQRLQQLAHRAG